MPEEYVKKLSRRVRSLLVDKDIPQEKMSIVRTLMNNSKLDAEEKYKAVIDLIEKCPDKKTKLHFEDKKVNEKEKKVKVKVKQAPKKIFFGPTVSSIYIDDLYRKYKHLKIFKKKYLIFSDNRFRFAFKKRLIPTKKFFKIFSDIKELQEKILIKLPFVIDSILKDETVENPVIFNYIRVFQKWMMIYPLSETSFDKTKWLDQNYFEAEFGDFIKFYFSFLELDTETKEQVIMAIESKLRGYDEFRKDEISPFDSEDVKLKKEKYNLKKEQAIYNFVMILRSFIVSWNNMTLGTLSNYFKSKFDIESTGEFLLILTECLIFKRNIEMKDIIGYYRIEPPAITKDRWDYSDDYLKQVGKDQDSRRQNYINSLKSKLKPIDEINYLINMRFDGRDILTVAFENHWHTIKQKRKEPDNIFETDFYTFIDDTLNYFVHALLPFIDGSLLAFTDGEKFYEGSLFTRDYFLNEKNLIIELQKEMNLFRTSNPNMEISYSEAKKIISGSMNSMMNVRRFFITIGSIFYKIGKEFLDLKNNHSDTKEKNPELLTYESIKRPGEYSEEHDFTIPFENCKLGEIENADPLLRKFFGKKFFSLSLNEGIWSYIMAFSFQMAQVCNDEILHKDLKYRKDLKSRLKDLV